MLRPALLRLLLLGRGLLRGQWSPQAPAGNTKQQQQQQPQHVTDREKQHTPATRNCTLHRLLLAFMRTRKKKQRAAKLPHNTVVPAGALMHAVKSP
jgi:hypothetical protein